MSPQINKKQIIKSVVFATIPYISVVIVLVAMLTHKNYYTFLLVILSTLFVSQLFMAVKDRRPPSAKEWFKMALKTTVMFSFIYFVYKWLGHYGVIGSALALLIIVAIMIYRQRKLFMDAIREVEVDLFGSTLEEVKKGERQKNS